MEPREVQKHMREQMALEMVQEGTAKNMTIAADMTDTAVATLYARKVC